ASARGGTLYCGVTSNLPRRAYEHREGLVPGARNDACFVHVVIAKRGFALLLVGQLGVVDGAADAVGVGGVALLLALGAAVLGPVLGRLLGALGALLVLARLAQVDDVGHALQYHRKNQFKCSGASRLMQRVKTPSTESMSRPQTIFS